MPEPTVSFRDLLAANPGTVTDDTEILITAGELRDRLDELGRLRVQAGEDAALVGWYLYAETPHSMRTAVLSNHFGVRAQTELDARMAALLPDDQPRDRAAQLALLRGATAPTEVWYYADDDEISSFDVYADGDTAKAHAVERYISEYEPDDEAFTWRKAEPRPGGDQGRGEWLLHHGESTGWHVSTMRVIASGTKASA